MTRDLTIIICTRNRADSLAITLESLARAEKNGGDICIRVVDNGSSDHTREVAECYSAKLPLEYLFEPTLGNYGKSHALNRALDEGSLGELVAVMDDDITLREDWVKAVLSLASNFQDKALFGGSIYISWPDGEKPKWAMDPRIRSWLFSAVDYRQESSLPPGMWFSGNHFWFRSAILENKRRFRDIWLTEPDFILGLADDGYEGIASPRAVVWHRVQHHLLDPSLARKRAKLVGCSFARVRAQPGRKRVKQAVLLRRYPFLSRLVFAAYMIKWSYKLKIAKALAPFREGFASELVALERFYNYRELLIMAAEFDEYKRGPRASAGNFLARLALSIWGKEEAQLREEN